MAWSRKEKKKFRLALVETYRTYKKLEIFVADELDERLEAIVPSSQDLDAAAFDLIEWADAKGSLGRLYGAFCDENPNHTFKVKSSFQASMSALRGERFTFTAASVTPDGTVTEYQREGQRHIFDLAGTPLEMVWIPAGDFWMGSPLDEAGRNRREGPQHRVTFAQGFWMGRYPVTQAQWRSVAGFAQVKFHLEADPSYFKGANRPVEQISWDSAQEFCHRLSRELLQTFKLPSEAEWEYACRAGTTMPFAFGKALTQNLAHCGLSIVRGTMGVGRFPANSWGLHDMHGNVWAWCEDTWHGSYDDAPVDGSAWIGNQSTRSLLRGGSWADPPRRCRSAYRGRNLREGGYNRTGFRVVCSTRVCS